MCGITGFLAPGQKVNNKKWQAVGKAMTDALTHRGPDSSGYWTDEKAPVFLGHRRLSIIDLSPEGHQPMHSTSERYILSYNGEIYNYRELMAELEQLGYSFRGHSDTEIFLAAVEHWGANQAIQKINGMFAIALWDRKDRVLHLVRDRLGKKPLYFGWAGNMLLFASELKAFHAHPDFKPHISRSGLSLYMRHACLQAPYTIYEGIYNLPAGCRITLREDDGRFESLIDRIEPYWHHARVVEEAGQQKLRLSDDDAVKQCETLLKQCVQDRMMSDVPLGAFLSGGLDSSTIVALMQAQSNRPIQTFSIGFEARGYNEAEHAKAIAAHLGTDHFELYLTEKETLDVIPKLPDMYDEPFADSSQIPTYLVSAFARKYVTVALSGDGGDELFGGYNRHSRGPAIWNKIKYLPMPVRRGFARFIRSISPERWNAVLFFHPQIGERLYKVAKIMTMQSEEAVYRSLVSLWDSPLEIVIGGHEPDIPLTDSEYAPPVNGFSHNMMYFDMLSYLPNDILTKVDRASMAVSLEARAPLLDRRMAEFAWRLPLHQKIRGGKGKWILRQVLNKYVPKDLFDRPKQGFSIPIHNWLRGELKDWAADLLDDKKIREQGLLNPKQVKAAWKAHLSGTDNLGHQIWVILMFQAWLERWMKT